MAKLPYDIEKVADPAQALYHMTVYGDCFKNNQNHILKKANLYTTRYDYLESIEISRAKF